MVRGTNILSCYMKCNMALSRVFIYLTLGKVWLKMTCDPVTLPSLPKKKRPKKKRPREVALTQMAISVDFIFGLQVSHRCLLTVVSRRGLDFLP